MENIIIYKFLDVIVSQPYELIIIGIIITILTGVLKTTLKFIKKVELTYFVPYLLGPILMVIYSLITKVDIKDNILQIIMNGVYAALISGIMFQVYKGIKDVGLIVFLKDAKTVKYFDELKNKLGSKYNAVTYAKRLSYINKDDISSMVEVLRGSGISEQNLYSIANDISAIAETFEKKEKKASKTENNEVENDKCN